MQHIRECAEECGVDLEADAATSALEVIQIDGHTAEVWYHEDSGFWHCGNYAWGSCSAYGDREGAIRQFTRELRRPYYRMVVRGYGNPDLFQFGDVAPRQIIEGRTLKQLRGRFERWRDNLQIGGGNCGPDTGKVTAYYADGRVRRVGRFSHNGRFWRHGRSRHA